MVANAIVPGLLDRYLARTGLSAQQTDDLTPHPGSGNLWEPLDEGTDAGAHGAFSPRAHHRSVQWRLAKLFGR
jgi:hypothetical protein